MAGDSSRLKELGLPNSEMSELLMFLVKPVQDMEAKIDGVKKQFDERLTHAVRMMDQLAEKLDGASGKINKIAAQPDKHENRISAVEGQAKYVGPLMDDVKRLDMDLKKFIGKLEDLMSEIKAHSNELDHHKRQLKEHSDRLSKQESNHKDLHGSFDEERRRNEGKWDELKDFRVKIQKEVQDNHRDALNANTAVQTDIKELRQALANLNLKMEQQWTDTQELSQDVKRSLVRRIEEQEGEFSELKKQIGHLNDIIDQKLYKDDDRMQSLAKSVEFLEQRADKLGMSMKQLKAEVGV